MTNFELIVLIVNQGFSEQAMSVARDCGARGGTVLNARGTARGDAETMFNITITPEKEMIWILANSSIKDKMLHAFYEKCGLDTAGQGIAFTLPVDDVVGVGGKKAPQKEVKPIEETKGL